jgi:hypothetical protein
VVGKQFSKIKNNPKSFLTLYNSLNVASTVYTNVTILAGEVISYVHVTKAPLSKFAVH